MHEGNEASATPRTRRIVDQLNPFVLQVLQGAFDIIDPESDVVETFAPPLYVAHQSAVLTRRSYELQGAVAERQHRFLDSLFLDPFPGGPVQPPDLVEVGEGLVEVAHSQGDMVYPFEHVGIVPWMHPSDAG